MWMRPTETLECPRECHTLDEAHMCSMESHEEEPYSMKNPFGWRRECHRREISNEYTMSPLGERGEPRGQTLSTVKVLVVNPEVYLAGSPSAE